MLDRGRGSCRDRIPGRAVTTVLVPLLVVACVLALPRVAGRVARGRHRRPPSRRVQVRRRDGQWTTVGKTT